MSSEAIPAARHPSCKPIGHSPIGKWFSKEERGVNMKSRKAKGKLLAVFGIGAVLVGGSLVAACGSSSDSGSSGGTKDATLVLDFIPGPVHAGIYLAKEKGYYEDQGINLEIIEPTSTADTLKLIDAGKADFGIADGIDLADQISSGRGAKGIMALTQKPSGGLITLTKDGYKSPADLDGKTVGVTGVPSDDAILDTVMKGGGGNPDSVNKVTIGFNGVQNLENGKIDAFTGFIPADGVQLDVDGYPTTSFALDAYGGPQYPGLVVFSTEDKISSDPDLMQGFVSATIQGYEETLDNEQAGLDALLKENPAIPEDFAKASLDAYMPMFQANAPQYGEFQTKNIEALVQFLLDNGLIDQSIPTDRYETNEFVDGS